MLDLLFEFLIKEYLKNYLMIKNYYFPQKLCYLYYRKENFDFLKLNYFLEVVLKIRNDVFDLYYYFDLIDYDNLVIVVENFADLYWMIDPLYLNIIIGNFLDSYIRFFLIYFHPF